MYTYQLETCNKKQFLFEFSFEGNALEISDCNSSGCCYVEYRLLRKDKTQNNEIFYWKGCLCTDETEPFELIFPDKINIKGEMMLYKSNDQNFIWINTFYCLDLENHFEGNIMRIPNDISPTPVDPIPDPIEPVDPIDPLPEPTIPEEETILPADYNDLFPYVYLRKWPDLTSAEEMYFMEYQEIILSPHVPNLYANFLSCFNNNGVPEPGAREKITAEAFEFVNGAAPYTGQYIIDTNSLPFPYNKFPAIYDRTHRFEYTTSNELEALILKELDIVSDTLGEALTDTSYSQLKDQVWQNVFALTVLNFFNIKGLQDDIKVLLVCNILDHLMLNPNEEELIHILNASIVLPAPVFPLPANTGSLQNIAQIEGTVVPYAIGDLHMIQHKLIGYRSGEIAHIENVLSGEIKERSNASSQEMNETTVNTNETILENDTTWETSLRGLNTEISNTLTGTDTNTDNYNKLEASYGPPTTGTYNGEVTLTRTPDLHDKTNDTHFAKKVLDQTIARMSHNIKQVFTRNQVSKTEEAVVHTLDNRTNELNVRGIYNWVNKIYNARVINYGNRFLLEFLIDKPFPNIEGDINLIENGLIPPANRTEPIISFESISRKNYATLAADYGVQGVPLPPEELKTFYVFFNDDKMTAQMLPIEEGYIPYQTEVNYTINSDMKLLVGTAMIDLTTSENEITTSKRTITLQDSIHPENAANVIPIVVNETSSYTSPPTSPGFYIAIGIQTTPSNTLMNTWRIAVYDAIIKAYTNNIAMAKSTIDEIKDTNKAKTKNWINRSVINSCKALLYTINLEKNTAIQSPIDSLMTDINQPTYYQFFESAMEWKESVYEFYQENNAPQKENIHKSIQNFHIDQAFSEYSDNKHVRVMVPVTPDFNYQMLYYLSTGLVPYTANPITPIIESDKPIAIALKKTTDTDIVPHMTDESWEIVVPTNMQWLQDGDELPFNNIEIISIS